MAIWIHDRLNPQVSSKCELYLYSREPTVYPTYTDAPIIGYNPNVYTNFEKVTVDGEVKNVKVDFSGVTITNKRLGDGSLVNCQIPGGCINDPWPRCDAFFAYTTAGDQVSCQSGGCGTLDCFTAGFFVNPATGELRYPYKIIDPRIEENAKYWNNVNLWYNGSYTGNVLVKNNGPSYENGGYEYLLTVGHPITTSPCLGPAYFQFLDPETNNIIGRFFECPCVAFGSSTPEYAGNQQWTGGWSGFICVGNDGVLTNDNYRLWVMSPGQEPIPNSIKRYKILKGLIPSGFPTYGWHNNHNITKTIIQNFVNKPDRSLPFSYGFGQFTLSNTQFGLDFIYFGQGDDGAGTFTVNPEGETIFMGWNGNVHGYFDSYNVNQTIDGPGKCNGNLFYKDEETDRIEVNTWCLPAIYHPEEIFSNYPENDPCILKGAIRGPIGFGAELNNALDVLNQRLLELNKPQLVTYQFLNTLFDTQDEINLPPISDNTEKFPLKEYPYLSRESKNSFYENTNLVNFEQRKMLQASELNELQEKFYRKQKLFVEFTRNWLSKKYLTASNEDGLGFNPVTSFMRKTNRNILPPFTKVNLIIPFSEDSYEIIFQEQNYYIKLKPNWYTLFSQYRMGDLDPLTASGYLINSQYTKNIDFVKIKEEILVPISVDVPINTSITATSEIPTISVSGNILIDVFNLVDCSDYSDLKDNSGGSSLNSPCGAKRNLLQPVTNKVATIDIQHEYSGSGCIVDEYFIRPDCYNNPTDSVASPKFSLPHMLYYAIRRRDTNIVDVFLSNGLLLMSVEVD